LAAARLFSAAFSNSKLSIVFLFLHHHFEARNKNAPWDNSGSELSEHELIDVVCKVQSLTFSLQVAFVEREWGFRSLSSGH